MSTSKQDLKIKLQEQMLSSGIWCCCYNCENWDKGNEECFRFNIRPPCEVIVTGCKEWLFDIPF